MIYTRIEDTIGQTPLLKLDASHYGIRNTDIYVKLEYVNPFGSIKDRSVAGMLPAEQLVDIAAERKSLIESSSGNAAKSMQVLANKYGVALTSVTNRIKIPEVERLLRYLGTTIVALPGRSECADPNDPDDAVGTIHRMVSDNPNGYFHTSQYTNRANATAHEMTTAAELYADLPCIDVFVAGVGTGGSSMGVIQYAKKHHKATTWVGVVAEPSDFLPGIRTRKELFETELFHQDDFDKLSEVTSLQALEALRTLVLHEGVLAGPTTGANFAAVLRYMREHDTRRSDGSRQTVVFLACDRLEPYLTYIEQRQPELFGSEVLTDLYTAVDHNASYDKPTNDATIRWLDDEAVPVIDTRGVKPYSRFHISGSINFPEEQLREVLVHGTPFAKGSKVLFVCPRGDRSALLAAILRNRGVEAYSLAGGLLKWRESRLGFEKDVVRGA